MQKKYTHQFGDLMRDWTCTAHRISFGVATRQRLHDWWNKYALRSLTRELKGPVFVPAFPFTNQAAQFYDMALLQLTPDFANYVGLAREPRVEVLDRQGHPVWEGILKCTDDELLIRFSAGHFFRIIEEQTITEIPNEAYGSRRYPDSLTIPKEVQNKYIDIQTRWMHSQARTLKSLQLRVRDGRWQPFSNLDAIRDNPALQDLHRRGHGLCVLDLTQVSKDYLQKFSFLEFCPLDCHIPRDKDPLNRLFQQYPFYSFFEPEIEVYNLEGQKVWAGVLQPQDDDLVIEFWRDHFIFIKDPRPKPPALNDVYGPVTELFEGQLNEYLKV
jgi:hypothetical protein